MAHRRGPSSHALRACASRSPPRLLGAAPAGKVATVKGHGATTTDTLLGGKLRLLQPKSGYRVNVDSLLLVAFAGQRRVERVVDLGAGVGALGLLALERRIAQRALLIEGQGALCELARRNLASLGLPGDVLQLDVASSKLRESGVPLVLCNPPYYPGRSHRPAQTAAKAAARSGDVGPFLRAAAGMLARKTGRALFSYPAPLLPELLAAASDAGLVAKRLRLVHARAGEPARLLLIELRAARPGGLVIEPPLFEWHGRERSPELAAVTGARAGDRR